MSVATLTNSPVVTAYQAKTRRSAELADQAHAIFPSGIVHDSRRTLPYGIYVDKASGARKWDVDGNEYVDYYGGHGALILGHNRPEVTAAVQAQALDGTHFGACHPLEITWGSLVREMVPSAETVRFHLVRHRGQPDGAAPRPRLHRAVEDRALQIALPRLARSCRVRRQQPLRRHADARRPRRHRRQHHPRALRRYRRDAPHPRSRSRHRRRHPGADRRQLRHAAGERRSARRAARGHGAPGQSC